MERVRGKDGRGAPLATALRDRASSVARIAADRPGDIVVALRDIGYYKKDVFVKTIGEEIATEFGRRHAKLSDNSPAQLRNDFKLFVVVYGIIPENTPLPIAEIRIAGQTVGYVSSFVSGITLESFYNKTAKSLNPELTLQYKNFVGKVVELAEKLHEKGVYHNDLNWGNVLVTSKGGVYLIDPQAESHRFPFLRDRRGIKNLVESVRSLSRNPAA